MFGLRSVCLVAAALLLGKAIASPVPVYHPADREVVHISPHHTTGGASIEDHNDGRINAPHPHINLGPTSDHGTYVLAPVTHGTGDHLRPYMPTPNQHGLGGVTRLDHITGPATSITRSHGQLAGARVSHDAANRINAAKDLVKGHRDAGSAHSLAGEAHHREQTYHEGQSAHHFQHGNMQAGAWHGAQASIHAGHATKHEQASANHHNAANAVNGPDAAALHHAHNSAQTAHTVHQHLTQAHIDRVTGHGNVDDSRHAANHASATSITHHNSATGHHL